MRVVGECFFWYRLTRVFPDKFHRAVKRLCVCVLNGYICITDFILWSSFRLSQIIQKQTFDDIWSKLFTGQKIPCQFSKQQSQNTELILCLYIVNVQKYCVVEFLLLYFQREMYEMYLQKVPKCMSSIALLCCLFW